MVSPLRRRYLAAMGIDVWVRRAAPREAGGGSGPGTSAGQAEGDPMELEAMRRTVAACTRCELHRGRKQTVFGVGDPHAEWLIIGEAPGAEEDRQGEPFVGRAGQLLNAMLAALGLRRESIYIANILKCRPPQNRDPRPAEVASCEPYLMRQIALVAPKVILAVGRIAGQNLLKTTANIGRLRGRVFEYGDTRCPLIVTYHPAYLLRSPREKSKAWQDLLLAKKVYRERCR
ncbi:MAG: uracil-DNA glycosylase [Beggiatoa sp.]|nr:uracil-DNA glycosylase [Beggiatoa sp.]